MSIHDTSETYGYLHHLLGCICIKGTGRIVQPGSLNWQQFVARHDWLGSCASAHSPYSATSKGTLKLPSV